MRLPQLKMSGFKLSLLLTLVVVVLLFVRTDWTLLETLELKSLDLRFKMRGRQNPGKEIVIVTLDDKSIDRLGRWPWPRSEFAKIVDRITQGDPRVIGVDIIFSEPETRGELGQLRLIKENLAGLGLTASGEKGKQLYQFIQGLEQRADNDGLLAASIKRSGKLVLSMFFDGVDAPAQRAAADRKPAPPYLKKSAYRFLANQANLKLIPPASATNLTAPIQRLGEVAAATGHANMQADVDGVARWEILLVDYQGQYYPSFAMQVARTYLELGQEDLRVNFGENIEAGELVIPTNERMQMLINYNGYTKTFPHYSVYDVLTGVVSPAVFKDKIVLIGATATGLHDQKVTPFSKALPGVEKHANVIENIIHSHVLYRANWMTFLDLFFVLFFGILSGIFLPKLPKLWGPLGSVALAALYLYFTYVVFKHYGMWLTLVYPLLTLVLCFVGVISYRFMTEEREKRKIRGAFQQYLNPSVVGEIIRNPQMLKLGGEKRELTVLFSDIRGFTTISEQLPPEALVHILNEYLTAMTDLILSYDGLLDKYMGDAIMAVFGAPIPQADHSHRACSVALDMINELRRLQAAWKEQNIPVLDIGVGVNSGPMVVGNMGSLKRFDYTVMGDSVNLGSRLEGANKEYGTNVIISEFTHREVQGAFTCRELDAVQVKGKKLPVRIYELRGKPNGSEEEKRFLSSFATGIECYKDRQWQQGITHFEQSLEVYPKDNPSRLYVSRCRELMVNPPPADWDGVFVMKTK